MLAQHTPHTSPPAVLVDDVRGFKDERAALVVCSWQEALTLLDQLGNARIDDLCHDYDLGGDDTIRPVVHWMVQLASTGSPRRVGQIHIHSASVDGGHWMRLELKAAGYLVIRNFALGMWTHQSASTCARVDAAKR
jgi:hypothetical protein